MSDIKRFLMNMGFREDDLDAHLVYENLIDNWEFCADIFEENLCMMLDDFDEDFVLQMFSVYQSVFMRTDFIDMLLAVYRGFGTDGWVTYIQYEWYQTGETSVFELMDSLKVGHFEAELEAVCRKVRGIWEEDYGEDAL